MKTSSTNTQYTVLPALYLNELETKSEADDQSFFGSLPSELAMHCLTGFSTWGDLAKLATVQSSFKNVVRDAANLGGNDSKWELAQALLEGTHGLERNPKLAVTYLRALSEENSPFSPAMQKLAECYLLGDGLEKDLDMGIKVFKDAANIGGDVDAAHKIALIYEYGEYGVEVDVVLAAEWFLEAAKQGHIEAMAEYAMCCELGCGREQNDEEALEWYTLAANMGHVESNFSVGEAFEEAKGVPQSDEEACLWYYKAAVMGDDDSKKALQRLQDIARIVLPGWAAVLRD